MSFLSKNLKFLRERNGKLSQEKLAKVVNKLTTGDLSRSAISSYEDGRAEPKIEVLEAIAMHFNITIDQLLKVDLARLSDAEIVEQKNVSKYVSAENLRILTVTVDAYDNESVALVPERASAGYTTGYADKEYIKELPKYYLPFLPKNRSFRAFEIKGDSMLPLKSGSIVIGEYVTNFNDVKDGQVCIVVSREGGIVLKKVYNRINTSRKTLLLKSNNLAYPPYEIETSEVLEIWRFSAFIGREFPDEPSEAIQEIKEAFWRLEDQVREVREIR